MGLSALPRWRAGTELLAITGFVNQIAHIVFSPDGGRIAVATYRDENEQNKVKVFASATGQEVLTLNGYDFVTFSSDGRWIAAPSGSREVTAWNATSGKEVKKLNIHSDRVESVAFSPDGKTIATSSRDGTIRISDIATAEVKVTVQRNNSEHGSSAPLIFSPDGKRIAHVDDGQTPRIWESATGRELFALKGHSSPVVCISWSPDGNRLLTSGYDRSAKVWDAGTGRELLTLEPNALTVSASVFAPDGMSIFTAGFDGTIKQWQGASNEGRSD